MNTQSLIVAGGGIGGMSVALGLALKGRKVKVLERASELREIGAGLQLGPNGLRALDQLGVLDRLKETAVYPSTVTILDIYDAKPLAVVALGKEFAERYSYPYVVVHRSDLLDALVAACAKTGLVEVETNKEVISVEDVGDAAIVQCNDGSTYRCDGLIGADGVRSVIRRQLFADDALQPVGYVAYRGTVPIADVSLYARREDLLIWVGAGLHLVQYPVRGGKLYNQVAVLKTDSPFDTEDEKRAAAAELDERFSPASSHVKDALVRIDRSQRWSLVDRAPIVTWARNRIALMGDAAHPMLQFLAQGACQALEDAVCLADCIERSDDLAEAFVLYQNKRVLRATRVQSTARFFDHVWHPEGVGASIRNKYFASHGPNDYEAFDWLYGHNVRD